MDIRSAEIVIWGEKAYVPSNARVPSGLFADIEPVFVVDPTLSELIPIVQKVLSSKPKSLSLEEIEVHRGLLPRITGARSWKRLGEKGICYIIDVTDKGYLVEMSRLDKKGRWEFDPDKRKTFPPGTDLSIVVQAILDDLKTRLI